MLLRTSILKQPNKILYFEKVLKLQEKYQKSLITGTSKNQFVWIGEHNLCYTIGRGGKKENLLPSFDGNKFNLFEIDRGGEVTCHMPGQLVVYLVLDLKNYKKDLNWLLRKIENIIIKTLNNFNIVCSLKKGYTGVWIGNKKIASIGIGCKRWVTIHGFSINVDCDLDQFKRIIPCGIKDCTMTNISSINADINIEEVKKIVKIIIQNEFNFKFVSE